MKSIYQPAQLSSSYQRAIVHVDGDAFFASCEVSRRPDLRGKPVVVGGLRGIAVALTYEAKARGVVRGMPVFQIKKLCPDVVILPGDYDLYAAYARRMYRIVGRYSDCVEEYSVDECFALLPQQRTSDILCCEEIARAIKTDLEHDLGITFSVGLATTKVLAKVASKHSKPSGLVFIPAGAQEKFLENLPVGKVWGIGPATVSKLNRKGIQTALQFARLPEWQMREEFAQPYRALWRELKGEQVYNVDPESHDDQKSIAATRTFRPPTTDKARVYAELAKNVERACQNARAKGLASRHLYCFLKSQEFQYRRFEITLPQYTNVPSDVLTAVHTEFEKNFAQGILYRATGITLAELRPTSALQNDLFNTGPHRMETLWETIDGLNGSVFLAASMAARKKVEYVPSLGLPYMGEVT